MCCFSQPVDLVSNTNIFARGVNGRQLLVYSMTYGAAADLAKVLPLPGPPHSREDDVRFINLEGYPDVFADMVSGFPQRASRWSLSAPSVDVTTLKVQNVGSVEASFVPQVGDFARLDERFRIPSTVWDDMPAYRDFGFAVFKLRRTHAMEGASVHPMAFEFHRRDPPSGA